MDRWGSERWPFATKEDIQGWLRCGKRKGATYVMIVCDMFDWTDYETSPRILYKFRQQG